MKESRDLVRDWLRKADSDLTILTSALNEEHALDTACFHAQQAAEKFLKAYLVAQDADVPRTHNLAKLVDLCRGYDVEFAGLRSLADALTPYAVDLRYDLDFWPSVEVAREARNAAQDIRAFVVSRLPREFRYGSL